MDKKISLKDKIFNFFFHFRYGTVMFLTGLIVVFWDVLSKAITDGKAAALIKGFISIDSSYNTGAAWSILNDKTWLLILLSIIFILAILIANWFFEYKDYFYSISMGLLLSGAIGNLIDRIRFGYVRDFIKLEFINFPIFNLADCAITVGVILLCIYFLIILPRRHKKEFVKELSSVSSSKKQVNADNKENLEESIENERKELIVDKAFEESKQTTIKKEFSKNAKSSKTTNAGQKNRTSSKTTQKSKNKSNMTAKNTTSDGAAKPKSTPKNSSTKLRSNTKKTTTSKGVKNV